MGISVKPTGKWKSTLKKLDNNARKRAEKTEKENTKNA